MKDKEPKITLSEILYRTGAVRFGTFTLASGKLSPYYIDLRIIPSFPKALNEIVEFYLETIKGLGLRFDRVGGIPTAGLVYASILSYSLHKPLLYVRREAKDYGRERKVEGLIKPGDRVLLIDDIATTGGSIIEAAKVIREEGGVVEDAFVLIDRQENAVEALRKESITLHCFTKILEVARFLHEYELIDKSQLEAIVKQITHA